MNQAIKECVYGKGTAEQIAYMARIGGMNEAEKELFEMLHENKTDTYIMDVMGLNRKTYEKIESSMRTKLVIAIFECINNHMNN